MWGRRRPDFDARWEMACIALARAVASAAGCTLRKSSVMYSFSVSDRGVIARFVPKLGIRDKLIVSLRADEELAHEAACDIAEATGEDVFSYNTTIYGREWKYDCVAIEPQDPDHITAVKRTMAWFLIDAQPTTAIDPPAIPGLIEPLRDARSLKTEGNKMDHCAARYALRVEMRKSFIFRLLPGMLPGLTRATVELRAAKSPRYWRLAQLLGYRNGPVSPETEKFVKTWLKTINANPQIATSNLMAACNVEDEVDARSVSRPDRLS